MIGFRGVPEGVRTVEPEPWETVESSDLARRYDFVIVGAGAGGGVVAGVLAEGVAKVLLLERAPPRRIPSYEVTTSEASGPG